MSTENINSGNVSTIPNKIIFLIPIILSSIVGLVLLVSGLLKAFEVDLFIRQIRDYEIITSPLLPEHKPI